MLPQPAHKCHSSFADHAACRRMLREGSLSFHAASQLLPLRVRGPVTIFYAFCRLADDGVDRASDKKASLQRLTDRLDAVYRGQPIQQPVDRAFADLVARYHLPRAVIDLLFEGFAWDSEGRRCATFSDVKAYSVRVAGTVGIIMAHLMGVKDENAFARAVDLGVAMQLTNIARDVGEDAHAGRLYLPESWLRDAGIDPDAFLAQPEMTDTLRGVTARLLHEADRFYQRADSGIRALPAGVRPAIFAARHIYRAIGLKVAANDFDSVTQRAVVSRAEKARWLIKAWSDALAGGPAKAAPPIPEARHLVQIAREASVLQGEQPTVTDRTIWALGLIARGPERKRV